MKRRELLAAAGSVAAFGAAGCVSTGGAGPPKGDRETPTETGTATPTPTPTSPRGTATVGDESAVLLPEENRPHEVLVRNAADEARDIGVVLASDGATRFRETWTLDGREYVVLTLVDPASYVVTVTLDGEAVGEVAVDAGRFDCNDSRTTVDVRPDGTVEDVTGATTTACRSPVVLGHDFEVTESGCGSRDHGATVAFESDAVTVAGAISAPNPCHGAALVGASWDSGETRLTLTVGTTDPSGDEVCVDCVGEIAYEARVAFAARPPASVAVEHRHWDRTETVATAQR